MSVGALPALGLVREASLQDSLIFGRQRRLLRQARGFGLIPLRSNTDRPFPLAGQIGIFSEVDHLRTSR